MLMPLPDTVLRTGETMRVHVLRPPEPGPADRLLAALGHKGAPWHADIADRLAGRLAACSLDTYIVGEIGDTIAGTVWVTVPADTRDVGTLGHVFTDPRHRQKGVCDHLLTSLLDLLRREGVVMIHLATGSPVAARIYERHGFRRCNGGIHRWTTDAEAGTAAAEAAYFTPCGPLTVRPVHRGDLPRCEALYNARNPWLLHDETLRVQAGTGFEGQFLAAWAAADGPPGRFLALEDRRRHLLGAARLTAQAGVGRGHIGILDWLVHPLAMADAGMLLAAALGNAGGSPFPRVRCWLAGCDEERAAALAVLGFAATARLIGEIAGNGRPAADLVAYERA